MEYQPYHLSIYYKKDIKGFSGQNPKIIRVQVFPETVWVHRLPHPVLSDLRQAETSQDSEGLLGSVIVEYVKCRGIF